MLENKCYTIFITIISYISFYDEVSSRSILFIYIAEQNNLHRVENFKCSLTLCFAKLPSMLSHHLVYSMADLLVSTFVRMFRENVVSSLDSKCLTERWLCYTHDLYIWMNEWVSINDCIMFQEREPKHWKI